LTSATEGQPAALFVSDLHLQAEMPRTAEAFFDFLKRHAGPCPRLYLLGDIFEFWAGDDDLDPFNLEVIAALRAVADGGTKIYWIAGNRDFLAGASFAEAAGLTMLSDPYVQDGIVLTHGDAMCTDDKAYMQFRAQVRNPLVQQQFLAQSLAQRKAFIAVGRKDSREAQSRKPEAIMDVNGDAVRSVFAESNTKTMIHGHTHRPALHEQDGYRRYVLPDWDCDGEVPRGGWIALHDDGEIVRVGLDGKPIN
jgi:UDP-2,3-diacylglucosamine hydrolase